MKRLVFLGVLVVLAVALTLAAQENTGKVVVFAGGYRLDFSLNFAIVSIVVLTTLIWFLLGAISASGRLPVRFRGFWQNRGLRKLNEADNDALTALILGDEILADKALRRAVSASDNCANSYLLRTLSALQARRLEIARAQLLQVDPETLHSKDAFSALAARVALASGDFQQALNLVSTLKPSIAAAPQVLRLKLFAYRGLGRWEEAIKAFRASNEANPMPAVKSDEVLGDIYSNLAASLSTAEEMRSLQSRATSGELRFASVIAALARGLLRTGAATDARHLLERALEDKLDETLLLVYQEVVQVQSRESLVFVETLISKNPGNIKLIEIAALVCEQEQLWGKAIARFESLYAKLPTARVAGRLERLYDLAGQPNKAEMWREKLREHLGDSRQLA